MLNLFLPYTTFTVLFTSLFAALQFPPSCPLMAPYRQYSMKWVNAMRRYTKQTKRQTAHLNNCSTALLVVKRYTGHF